MSIEQHVTLVTPEYNVLKDLKLTMRAFIYLKYLLPILRCQIPFHYSSIYLQVTNIMLYISFV